MAIFKTVEAYPPFDYGSAVRVTASVAANYGFTVGSVFGFHRIDTTEQAEMNRQPVGTTLVLVEDPTGKSHAVPANDLEILNT